jgi:hypothetical protein
LILSTLNFHHNFIGFGFRLLAGIWSSDACFTSFWLQTNWEEKIKEILEKIQRTKMEIIMENIYQEERYFIAKKRVDEIKGFYSNLASYVL